MELHEYPAVVTFFSELGILRARVTINTAYTRPLRYGQNAPAGFNPFVALDPIPLRQSSAIEDFFFASAGCLPAPPDAAELLRQPHVLPLIKLSPALRPDLKDTLARIFSENASLFFHQVVLR